MAQHPVQDTVILVADVTASVELYERLGNALAFDRIAGALDRLREIAESADGRFVQSRGDDILCVFPDCELAADAALAMVACAGTCGVELHVAVHRGEAIVARDSIFGDAVNVTYRLAGCANANEVLVTETVADGFSAARRRRMRSLRAFYFKGRTQPIDVHALDAIAGQSMTQLPAHIATASVAGVTLKLCHRERCWEIRDGDSLSIGREDGNDVIIPQTWVSRRHALLLVRNGAPVLNDRSSHGCFVAPSGLGEVRIRRQAVPLAGSGIIGLGTSTTAPDAEILTYAVLREQAASTLTVRHRWDANGADAAKHFTRPAA